MDIQVVWIKKCNVIVYQCFCVDLLIDLFQMCQLYLVIDFVYFLGVVGLFGNYVYVCVYCYGDQVGEIVFVLGVVVGEVWQVVVQEVVCVGEDVCIDFVDCFFVVVGVFLFYYVLYFVICVVNYMVVV